MWIDCSHNPTPDEVDFEKVICADCMQGKKTKGFTTTISNLFGRLLGRERTAEVTDEHQAAAFIMEGARFLVQAIEFDPRLEPIVREGVMGLAHADSGEYF
jgi:hypothetical protein